MKKLFMRMSVLFALIVGSLAISHAGTPQEQNLYMSGPNLSNTSIIGSTFTTVGTLSVTATVSAPTCSGGSTTYSGRNCFTNFTVQIPTTTVLNILDGATTSYILYGSGLGTTGTTTRNIDRDHLGPWCGTAGNAVTFNLTNTAGLAANPLSFSYEGYTQCGGTGNRGVMY